MKPQQNNLVLPQKNGENSLPDAQQVDSQDILTTAKGGGVSFAGRVVEYVVRFGFGILVARVIGVEEYGLYTLGTTVALIASSLALLGLQTGMMRFLSPAIHDNDEKHIWGLIQVCLGLPLVVGILIAAGLYVFADPLAMLLFNDPRMGPVIRIISFLVPFDTLASIAYVITISFKQPKYSVIANNIVAPVLKLLLASGFLAIGLSTKGVLWAHVIASVAAALIMMYYANVLFSLKRRLGSARQYVWPLLRYSIPVHLGWMVNTIRATLSTLILGFLGLTVGVGVYTAASRLSQIGTMFYLAVGNISTPIIADLHSQGEKDKLKAYYQTTTRWMVMFNLPVFLTSVIFARPLLMLFGDDFTTGATSMIILATGTLAYTATGVGSNILDMTDHPKMNTINSVIMFGFTILLNLIMVPLWGVVGAALASSVSTFLVNVVCLLEVWVLLKMQPYNRGIFKLIIAGALSSLAAYVFDRSLNLPFLLELLLGGGLLWGIYALCLWLFKFSPEDRIVIESMVARLRRKLPVVQNTAQ